jgi:Transcriptional regulators
MNDHSVDTVRIEMELALLIRRVTSIALDRKLGILDRSAYLLLDHISTHGSIGVKTLAEKLQLDISTVSRQASALERKDYVLKIPDREDGRSFTLELTEKGTRALTETKAKRIERVESLLDTWPAEEREQFAYLLHKFNRSFL